MGWPSFWYELLETYSAACNKVVETEVGPDTIMTQACVQQGRIFMTHPTKAICGTLLKDFIKLSGGKDNEPLYRPADLTGALEKSEVVDFHQTVEVNGIKVMALPGLMQNDDQHLPLHMLSRHCPVRFRGHATF